MINYGFPGFLDELQDAPGAPGVSSTEKRLSSAKYFSPGVLTSPEEMTILIQDRERELENARVSAKFIDPSEDCVAGDCGVFPAAPPGCRLPCQSNSQTPLNNKQVSWALVHGAGGTGRRAPEVP